MPRTTVRAAALISSAAAVTLISGCGLLGQSWDVRMEVTGPGSAAVGTKFAGEPDIGTGGRGPADAALPFVESRNVGFGFNDLAVENGAPGTTCRVFVDDQLRSEATVDAAGTAWCEANNQDDPS